MTLQLSQVMSAIWSTQKPAIFTATALWTCLVALPTGLQAQEGMIDTHGYSFYGDLSYAEDYSHFSYVDPDAPKGGDIALGVVGTFDSMHPYTRKGRAGALSTIMYESLLGDGTGGSSAPTDV